MAKKKLGSYEFRYYELPSDFPILALIGPEWIRRYDQADLLHFHNHLEIGYCRSGEGELVIEENAIPYSSGLLSFIPANIPHATSSHHDLCHWEYLFVDIKGFLSMNYGNNKFWINQFSQQASSNAYVTTIKERPQLVDLVFRIMDEMRYKKHYYRESVKNLIIPLLIEIYRINEASEDIKVIPTPKSTIAIADALEFIGSHYMEDIKIGDLAKKSHMSETHFRRVFQEITGRTPLDYINTVRIRASCALLKSTNDSIQSIASRCGYASVSTFDRNFTKVMKTPPLKWRNDPDSSHLDYRNYDVKALNGWT